MATIYKVLGYVILEAGWFLETALLYVYFMYSVLLVESIYFNEKFTLYISRAHQSFEQSIQNLKLAYANVHCLHNLFERCFSLMPFTWLSCLFFLLSGNLVIQVRSSSSTDSDPTQILFLISEHLALITFMLVFLSAIYIASMYVERLSRLREQVLFTLLAGYKPDLAKLDLIQLLDRNQLVLTGWSLFTVDKKLLLSFCAGLTSFSVLFANLSGADL